METKLPASLKSMVSKANVIRCCQQPDHPPCHQPGSVCPLLNHGNERILDADSTISLVTLGLNGLTLDTRCNSGQWDGREMLPGWLWETCPC